MTKINDKFFIQHKEIYELTKGRIANIIPTETKDLDLAWRISEIHYNPDMSQMQQAARIGISFSIISSLEGETS